MDDLVAVGAGLFVGGVEVVDVDGERGVLGCGGVAGDQLDVCAGGGGGVAGDPAEVEFLGAQAEKVGVEALRGRDVGNRQVGGDTDDSHAGPSCPVGWVRWSSWAGWMSTLVALFAGDAVAVSVQAGSVAGFASVERGGACRAGGGTAVVVHPGRGGRVDGGC